MSSRLVRTTPPDQISRINLAAVDEFVDLDGSRRFQREWYCDNASAYAAHHRMAAEADQSIFSVAVKPTNRRDWLMSTLQKTIADKFLAKLAEDEDFDSKKIEQITDLLAADKKPKADDFAKVFASDDAGDIE